MTTQHNSREALENLLKTKDWSENQTYSAKMAWQASQEAQAATIAQLQLDNARMREALEIIDSKQLSSRFDCQMYARQALKQLKE